MFSLQQPRYIPTLPFATDAAGLACRLMSVSVRERPTPALPRNDALGQNRKWTEAPSNSTVGSGDRPWPESVRNDGSQRSLRPMSLDTVGLWALTRRAL